MCNHSNGKQIKIEGFIIACNQCGIAMDAKFMWCRFYEHVMVRGGKYDVFTPDGSPKCLNCGWEIRKVRLPCSDTPSLEQSFFNLLNVSISKT